MSDEQIEPILKPDLKRYTFLPIKYKDVYKMYKEAQALIWTAEEIDMSTDLKDFRRLSPPIQHFLKWTFAFFVSADGIVMEGVAVNIYKLIQMAEARQFYAVQMYIEAVHAETYSLLIDTLIPPEEKDELFRSLETSNAIRGKRDWFKKYCGNSEDFATVLLANLIFEGIFFSSSFCSIFWFKKQGLMPGVTFSNELISRDEGLHVNHGALIYSYLTHTRYTPERWYAMLRDAVKCEHAFVCEVLPEKLAGMNKDMMCQYVEYVADRLSVQLGYEKIYNSTNPFDWMELISLQGKTNMFERRVGEYRKANVSIGKPETTEDIFSLHENF